MRRFLTLIVLFTHLSLCGQIDQDKLDSLERSIDSSTKTQKNWQDSFARAQDSIYRSSINKYQDSNLSAERKTKVKKRSGVLLRIVIIVALIVTAVFIVLRKRKIKT